MAKPAFRVVYDYETADDAIWVYEGFSRPYDRAVNISVEYLDDNGNWKLYNTKSIAE